MPERFNEPVAFFLLVMSIILITPLLSERVKLPGTVGITPGGMLIGPYGFGLLDAGDRGQFLSTIGPVCLMFSAGLEVDINQLLRVLGARSGGITIAYFIQLFVLLNCSKIGSHQLRWTGKVALASSSSRGLARAHVSPILSEICQSSLRLSLMEIWQSCISINKPPSIVLGWRKLILHTAKQSTGVILCSFG